MIDVLVERITTKASQRLPLTTTRIVISRFKFTLYCNSARRRHRQRRRRLRRGVRPRIRRHSPTLPCGGRWYENENKRRCFAKVSYGYLYRVNSNGHQ
jgi:hypothetical protein